jgi:antirestriction protein ArdC
LTHATGHGSRLDRQFGKRFGDDAYAAEELLAGLAQSILCAEYGLPNELHDSHASYIHHWAKILRADKTAILHAAAILSDTAVVKTGNPLQPFRVVLASNAPQGRTVSRVVTCNDDEP